MRRDGIPYVQNPKTFYPPIDISKLSLDELKSKYLKACGKSNGNPSVCSRCASPCPEGKRAIQLLANEFFDDKVPLSAGKTLIERAKEENAKRRAEEAEKAANVLRAETKEETKIPEEKPKKRKYQKMEDWWEKSLEAPDQIEWVVDKFGISRTQAKKKIYAYRYNHGLVGTKEEKVSKTEEKKPEIKEEDVTPSITKNSNDIVFLTMESKIDELMKLQADYKAKVEEYTKKLKEVSEQIDVVCRAMDIFDKT